MMNNQQLQGTAYLYGRCLEKLNHSRDNIDLYNAYIALRKSLWFTLKANGAMNDDGTLKLNYINSMEAGRDSVADTNLLKNYYENPHNR